MKYVIYVLVFLLNSDLKSQSVVPKHGTFGVIIHDDSLPAGSGFVFANKKTVLTCAHVIENRSKFYFGSTIEDSTGTVKLLKNKLKVVKILPAYDMAILESDSNLCDVPFSPDKSSNIYVSQRVFYVGFDSEVSQEKKMPMFVYGDSVITHRFIKKVQDTSVAYFLFRGSMVKQGYSGGPVFNEKGQIIGMLQGKKERKGDEGWYVMAYYIKPIFQYFGYE